MQELRKDPILNRWSAIMKDSKPPEYYQEDRPAELEHKHESKTCQLCPGRESETPNEIFSFRDGNTWLTRVIPGLDPLFRIEGELGRKAVGMYDRMNGVGANEIIIESPFHDKPADESGIVQMTRVVKTYRNRMSELEKDPRLRYSLIYKDRRRNCGGFGSHPQSQIIAVPVIPRGVKDELDGAKAYYYYKERCIYCDIIAEESRGGKRVILDSADFISFVPYSPRFPFEFWIMPKRHNCTFQEIDDDEISGLSLVLMTSIAKLRKTLGDPDFTYVFHSAPNRLPRRDYWHTIRDDFHWHIEVVPRPPVKSSFEWDTEFHILTTSPEDAAKYLKEG
jgi:UDPglucose--hexose-1-phosphate uridylyltransferase